MSPGITPGRVFWITGLAGAGKTTLATLLADSLREDGEWVVFLDGDTMREVFGGAAGHSPDERRLLAGQYGRLCRLLAQQGATVVCATISMFHAVRRWNRENISRYCEVYVRVPLEVLEVRDQKGLYAAARRGEAEHVLGVNAPFEEPESPDIMIDNDGSRAPQAVLNELRDRIEQWSVR